MNVTRVTAQPSDSYVSDERLYLDGAGNVVGQDDPARASLLVPKGGTLTKEQAEKYGLTGEAKSAETAADAPKDEVPAPDPAMEKLAAAGFDTEEKIAAASDEELLAVPGIGPATVKRLREGGATPPENA